MASPTEPTQTHPQWSRDRATLDSILQGEATDLNLVEAARLRIRYNGFPGAADIQRDLNKLLERWDLSEADLFAKTRVIHDQARVYRGEGNDQEDWS